MKMFLQKAIKLALLTAVIVGLVLLVQLLGAENLVHSGIWGIIIFSSLVGLGVALVNMYFVKGKVQINLVAVFMGTTLFRMLASIIFITIIFFQGLENQIVWIADFFAVYLFYLVFEIYSIISNLRAISNEGENND